MIEDLLTCIYFSVDLDSKSLSDLQLVNAERKHQQLHIWNNTSTSYDANQLMHVMIENQSQQTPDAIAVTLDKQELTYRDLSDLSNRLAHYLRGLNIGPGAIVAVYMNRDLNTLVALLGILKSGAAFLPLDTEYPAERISYMLSDSNASCILTSEALVSRLTSIEVRKICLDAKEAEWLSSTGTAVTVRNGPDDLAYVIYTSGSTGKPKGVMITQAGISHYAQWATAYYDVAKGCGAPVHSSLAFDLTLSSLFCPLMAGKTVFMIADELGLGGLVDALKQRQDYSLIKITPAHLRLLQDVLSPELLSQMQPTVVIGGEALYRDDLAYWHAHGKNIRFINEYGATETSVACTIYEVGETLPTMTSSIPVGKAIPGSQMYVLGTNLELLPVGVTGEIYLSGNQLARGYWNKEDKTQERFIAHPYLAGERLYKTGDLGRLLPDGDVEYIGRYDGQVKVNGYRVDLGEPESVLRQSPLISGAVVLMRNQGDRQYLDAYVVVSDSSSLGEEKAAELRANLHAHMKQILPIYMLPSVYVLLDAFPLTENGKIDKPKLKLLPKQNDWVFDTKFEAPTHIKEQVLLSLCQEVMGNIPHLGINDDLMYHGITSIQVVMLANQIATSFGVRISISKIYENPTIKNICGLIHPKSRLQKLEPLLKMNSKGSRSPLFLFHPGGGLAFAYAGLARKLPDQPIYAINNPRFFDTDNPFASIQDMAKSYIEIVRSIQPQGKYRLGGWSLGGIVAYCAATLLQKEGAEVDFVIMFDAYNHSAFNGPVITNKRGISEYLISKGINSNSEDANLLRINIENDNNIAEKYEPEPFIGRVILFKSTETLDRTEGLNKDTTNGWLSVVSAENLRVFFSTYPHDELMQTDSIEQIVPIIETLITQSDLAADGSTAKSILFVHQWRVGTYTESVKYGAPELILNNANVPF